MPPQVQYVGRIDRELASVDRRSSTNMVRNEESAFADCFTRENPDAYESERAIVDTLRWLQLRTDPPRNQFYQRRMNRDRQRRFTTAPACKTQLEKRIVISTDKGVRWPRCKGAHNDQ